MKKGLLLVIGVSASLAMAAQAPRTVSGAQKPDLKLSHLSTAEAEAPSFYAQANLRQGNPTVQINGTKFSSSRNALTVWVSQSNCMTANQTLNVALFTHRISFDWSPAGVNSGYIQQSWTLNNGASWDSMYFDNDGSQLFRYPSGAIINPTGNTSMASAVGVIAGPWTNGSSWEGYYLNSANLVSGNGNTGVGTASNNVNSFPRIDIASYSDSSVWVTGSMVVDDDAAGGYLGAVLNHGWYDGSNVIWSMDTILPAFHQDGAGANDAFGMTHLAFSANGQYGYAVFFGVQASASTPETRSFQPIVYNTTDGGATWSNVWAPFDYTSIAIIANNIYPTSAGDLKPWFSMSEGSDVVVDNNNQLHIICTIENGYSDDDDSLGYTTTFTNIPAGNAHHYIYDVHTTGTNTWDAVLVDSLVTSATTTQSIFTYTSTPLDVDARIQATISPSRDHIFYFHADSDPNIAAGENAYQDIFGIGIDWSTGMKTAKEQFTFDGENFFYYASNLALISGSTYTIPVSSSLDRDGSHATETTFDHYYVNDVTFDESEFVIPVGINETQASFGTVGTFPNPATDVLNVNIKLNNNEAVVVTMYNALGQAVVTESRNMSAGANMIQLNTSNLEAGVYFLSVNVGTATSTSKVVVQ